MTGRIELHHETNGRYRVRLVDDLRNTLAVSTEFDSEKAALEGVFALREIAGTAHISYCSPQDTTADDASLGATPDSENPPMSTLISKEFWPHR